MEKLTVRPSARQITTLVLFTLVLAVVAAFLLRRHLAGGDASGRILGFGIGFGAAALTVGWCAVMYSLAYTECTAAGIRSRGLGLPWRCDWDEVGQIAIRPAMRGPTATVLLTTVSGRQYTLGAPVSGGVMADRDFGNRAREIRDYWQRAAGRTGPSDLAAASPAGAPVASARVRPSGGASVRALVAVLLAACVAALPVVLLEGGPALKVRLGGGEPGVFTAYQFACPTTCSWVGGFAPADGARYRDGVVIAAGASIDRLGQSVPAVYTGNARLVYPAGGGTSWIFVAVLIGAILACLLALALWAAVPRMRSRRMPPRDRPPPGPGSAASTARSSSTGRFLATAGAVVVIVAGAAVVIVQQAMPAASVAPATLACADYSHWLLAQSGGGPPGQDLAFLSKAEREAPAGSLLSADLDTLSTDATSAIAQAGTTAGSIALLNTGSDMSAVTKACG